MHAHRYRALVKSMISKILQDLRKRTDIDSLVENIKSVYLIFEMFYRTSISVYHCTDCNDSSWYGGKGHGHIQADVGSLECLWPLRSIRWKKYLPGMIMRAAAWARLCLHVLHARPLSSLSMLLAMVLCRGSPHSQDPGAKAFDYTGAGFCYRQNGKGRELKVSHKQAGGLWLK